MIDLSSLLVSGEIRAFAQLAHTRKILPFTVRWNGADWVMPAGTGDIAIILSLPDMLVGSAFGTIANMFGAPEWGTLLAGIIGVVIWFAFIAKWIPHEDG